MERNRKSNGDPLGKIESYDFGKIVVEGQVYTSDLIIFPDHIKRNWWRKEGHKLSIEDLNEIVKARPEILVVGTGYSGCVEIPKETEEFMLSRGIQMIAKPTREAVELYNRLFEKRKVVGAFHLTC